MIYLLIINCEKVKAYYSLSRLCKENGFKKFTKDELPIQMGNYKIVQSELINDI